MVSNSTPVRIEVEPGAPPTGHDVVFVPTGVGGAPGPLATSVLRQLKLSYSVSLSATDLSPGFGIIETDKLRLAVVITVGLGDVADALRTNLTNCLRDPRLQGASSLWLPLMGVGGGGLRDDASLGITLECLKASSWLDRTDVLITISASPKMSERVLSRLRRTVLGATAQSDKPREGDSPEKTQFDEEASAAIGVARGVAIKRVSDNGWITTSLLFFALVQRGDAAQGFGDSRSAMAFANALAELAGSLYKDAWASYFRPDSPEDGARVVSLGSNQYEFSPNLTRVIDLATGMAAKASKERIGISELIEALFEVTDARYSVMLKSMGVDPPILRRRYHAELAAATPIYEMFVNDLATGTDLLRHDRYAAAIAEFLTHGETHGPISVSIQAPWGAGKSSLMWQIRAILDPEEVKRLAETRNGDTRKTADSIIVKPFQRLLNGAFGFAAPKERVQRAARDGTDAEARKRRSLLSLGHVLKFLNDSTSTPDKKCRSSAPSERWTIWFNAWKYESSEQVWAGLVDAIVSQVSDRLEPIEREAFLLRLNLARIDDGIVRRKIYERIVSFWWNSIRKWVVFSIAAVSSLLGIATVVHVSGHPLHFSQFQLGAKSAVVAALKLQIATCIYAVFDYVRATAKIKREPAKFSLAEYLRVPDYAKSVGVVHQVYEDLRRVLQILPTTGGGVAVPKPLVIFIDDLDRCSPSKVATVVEGVNMFLASDLYQCMFVIGMDPQMVAAALEQAHKDVRDRLPKYEQGVPLGWRFMDKFIQLPFTIPQCERSGITEYVNRLLPSASGQRVSTSERPDSPAKSNGTNTTNGSRGNDSVRQGPIAGEPYREAEPISTVLDPSTRPSVSVGSPDAKPSDSLAFESRDVRIVMHAMAEDFSTNPREIKRLLNMVRFNLHLRSRLPENKRASLEQCRRWIVLCLKWPDMMRWLQWGAEQHAISQESSEAAKLVKVRLKRLEDQAAKTSDFQAWRRDVSNALGLALEEVSWLKDVHLFEFFRHEAAQEKGTRLSTGAELGFY